MRAVLTYFFTPSKRNSPRENDPSKISRHDFDVTELERFDVFIVYRCLQSSEGLKALPGKIRSDLLGVQAAGLGFWPFVDLVSYACLPVDYIPVFVNGASFVWTIFLSFKSRAAKRAP